MKPLPLILALLIGVAIGKIHSPAVAEPDVEYVTTEYHYEVCPWDDVRPENPYDIHEIQELLENMK